MTAIPEPEASTPERPNPYPGARPFHFGEPIHGRVREIAELRDLLVARRIVLLYSPSGAGKSSLLAAGLRPELEQRDFRVLPTIRVSLGTPPGLEVGTQNRYVLSTLLSLEEGRPADRLLTPGELGSISLDEYFSRVAADDPDRSDPCFVFDQFEELVTLDPTDVEAKKAFLQELGVALRDRSRWAVFAMREDFIAQLDPYLGLVPTRLASRYRLDLLGRDAAHAAAQRPAAGLGVVFTDEAANQLIDDLRKVKVQRGRDVVEEPGPYVEPVQLQVACRRLWSSLDPADQEIGLDDVTALGSVDEALADFYVDAIETVAAQTGVAEREIRTWVDTRLITEQGFRAQALEGPGPAGSAVLAALENTHLIRAEQRRGTLWYELSHDRLVGPVRESNAAWRVRHLSTLQLEAQTWDRQGQPPGMLMTGEPLAEAEAWAARHPDELLPIDRKYLDACRAEDERLQLQHKVARRNKVLAIVMSVVGLLAIAGLIGALALWNQSENAKKEAVRQRESAQQALADKQEAEAARASAEAESERKNAANAWLAAAAEAPDGRTRLAAWQAAYRANPGEVSAEQRRQLTTAQHYLEHDPLYLAWDAALDSTGATMARAGVDGGVELVDVDTLDRQTLLDRATSADAVAFSPTDDRLAVLAGAAITIWDTSTKASLVEAELPPLTNVGGVSLDLAGDLLAAVPRVESDDFRGPLLVWDATTGEPIDSPTGLPLTQVALSADGTTLAALDDRTDRVGVWRREGVRWVEVFTDEMPLPPGGALALGPSGARLGVGLDPVGGDGVYFGLRVVDLSGLTPPANWSELPVMGGSTAVVTALTFPDDETLRWVLDSGALHSADARTLTSTTGQPVPAHERASFSADGRRLIVVSGTPAIHTVVDAAAAPRLVLGRQVARQGATAAGRSVAAADAGIVDERAPGAESWTRGISAPAGVRSVALSTDGRELGVIAESTALGTQPEVVGNPSLTASCDVGEYELLALSGGGEVAAVGPDGQGRVCVQAEGAERRWPSLLPNEELRALAVSRDGATTATGTSYSGAGSIVVYDAEANLVAERRLPLPVTAVALSPDATVAVAGDEQGTMLAFALDRQPGPECSTTLSRLEPVVALDLGTGSDGARLLAAGSATAVSVFRIGDDLCLELVGGFDLQRDEGQVLDLAFDDDGGLAVLESDLFVFELDPLSPPAEVDAKVDELLAERGWTLTDDRCQELVGRDCPPKPSAG